jgi:RNA polymerase sporulation-specific sigma factor
MENLSDELLTQKAKQGDIKSLDFLMQKYKKLANKIARSYFLLGAEYDDLLQEAMIGLYKAISSFNKDSTASFHTFAHMCITRNVQSAVKTANRQKNQILNSSLSLDEKVESGFSFDETNDINLFVLSTKSPDEKLIENENFVEIKEKIKDALSNFELKVLMHYLSGESYTQIAQKLNVENKSIDNALSRIRNKLVFLKK